MAGEAKHTKSPESVCEDKAMTAKHKCQAETSSYMWYLNGKSDNAHK